VSAFLTLLKRDVTLGIRDGAATGTALGFYLVVVSLMPLGLGPDLKLLSRIAPGVLWIGLLLAALLSLPRLFEIDAEDGSLDALSLGPLPLELVCLAKAAAHWLTTCVPLCVAAPILGLLLNLDLAAYPALAATLLVGTPAVSLLGGAGAALTLKARRGGVLIALLVLPLYIPTLIFGIAAISAVVTPPASFLSPFLMTAAVSLAALVVGPVAAAAALRVQGG
jgi:heme exporter protein B